MTSAPSWAAAIACRPVPQARSRTRLPGTIRSACQANQVLGRVERERRVRRHVESDRPASLKETASRAVDLLVIGGGIVGAGVARDAAMRGMRTVLVEQNDLAFGTSGRSSRLIHGGLRYLEHGELRLVFESLRERAVLRRIAPHLVWPLPFVFPVHDGDRLRRWQVAAGMWMYDLLSLFRNVSPHKMLGKRALLTREPGLRAIGLRGGARYFDAQCDDARLVVATARSAHEHGATILTYTTVTGLTLDGGRVTGATVRDVRTGREASFRASIVVNATGPWADQIRRMEDPKAPRLLRLTKGTHAVVPRERMGNHEAITFTSPLDGRVMFVLPWGVWSYIGTTDTDTAESPDEVRASSEDIRYLLRSANSRFPNAHLGEEDVVATWAGLRPLIEDGATGATAVSREHVIADGPGGMVTVAGGKLTTYRLMAAQVVDHLVRRLNNEARGEWPSDAGTELEPLPGGESASLATIRALGIDSGIDVATVEHMLRHYGTEAAGIFNLMRSEPGLADRLQPDHPAVSAEVLHAARKEFARTRGRRPGTANSPVLRDPGPGRSGGGPDCRVAGAGTALDPCRTAAGGGRIPGPDRPDTAPHRRAGTSANFQGFALPAVLAGVPMLTRRVVRGSERVRDGQCRLRPGDVRGIPSRPRVGRLRSGASCSRAESSGRCLRRTERRDGPGGRDPGAPEPTPTPAAAAATPAAPAAAPSRGRARSRGLPRASCRT